MRSCKKPECKLSKSEQSLPLQRPVQSDYTLNKGSLSKQKQLAAKPIRSMKRLWMSLNSLVDSVISDWFSPIKTKLHEFVLSVV